MRAEGLDTAQLLEIAVHDASLIERDRARARWLRRADHAAVTTAIALLDSPSRAVRRRVTRLLAGLGTERALPAMRAALGDETTPLRAQRQVARWLRERGPGDEATHAVLQAAHLRAVAAGDEGLLRATTGAWLDVADLLAVLARGPESDETTSAGTHEAAAALLERWQTGSPEARQEMASGLREAMVPWAPGERTSWPNAVWLLDEALTHGPKTSGARPRTERQRRPSASPPFGLQDGEGTSRPARADAVLALYQPRLDINLGVAVRSAEALGLAEVWLVGDPRVLSTVARGTDTVIPVVALANGAALLAHAAAQGRPIVAVQQAPGAEGFHAATYPPRPIFLLGAEDNGLPAALLSAAAHIVEIPLFGVVDSLNVATAATAVLAYWRQAALDS